MSTEKENQPSTAVATKCDFKLGPVDFSRPIISQVYNLNREEYLYLNSLFKICNASCRFFENDFLEICSRTVWWVIPLLWLPWAIFVFNHTKMTYELTTAFSVKCAVGGFFFWTLLEYFIHRFIFHFPEEYLPDSRIFRILHFLCHGVHHVIPADPLRLVLPPALFIILQTPFLILFSVFLPQFFLRAAYVGVVLGYICYDMIHYSEHHVSWELPGLYYMKIYHMKHHYKYPWTMFGVTNPFWDFVFGTTQKARPVKTQ